MRMDAGDAHDHFVGVKPGNLGLMTAWNYDMDAKEEDPDEKPKEVKLSIEMLETLEPDLPGTSGDYSSNVRVVNLPILGRAHVLQDRSGFMTLGFIVLYWVYGSWSTCCVILQPHIEAGDASEYLYYFYLAISVLCITSLFRASTTNPGRIPFSREPAASPEHMTSNHCQTCRRRRPQRSHHCRRCGQCILRMDHHCPWINNCVGQENHWAFVQLLWYALLMSVTSLIICISHIYYWPPCSLCDKESFIIVHQRGFLIATVIVSSLMAVLMAVLLASQTMGILYETLWEAFRPYLVVLDLLMAVVMIGGAGGLLALHLFSLVRATVLGRWAIFLVLVQVGLALGMTVTSLNLITYQIIGLRTDMTTIDWMKLQDEIQRKGKWDVKDVPQVNKSCLKAHDDLCGRGPRALWPFPCRRRRGPLYVTYPQVV